MRRYERETRVAAPLEDVWLFHSRAEGLETLTPDWLQLRIESTVGPDGDPDPDVLATGSEIAASVRPFGIGPRQRWRSRIVDRDRSDGAAYFRDEMIDGPFDRWVHTHAFYADGAATIVRDSVEFDLPLGPIGNALEPLSSVGFEPMFRYRHGKTKAELEDEQG